MLLLLEKQQRPLVCEIEKAITQSQLRTHFIAVNVPTGLKMSQMPPSEQETRRHLTCLNSFSGFLRCELSAENI